MKQNCVSSPVYDLPDLYGLDYAVGLSLLKEAGWREAFLGESYAFIKTQDLNYRLLAECNGFDDFLQGASETICRFTFSDSNGELLEIQTVGEALINRGDDSLVVAQNRKSRIVNAGITCPSE